MDLPEQKNFLELASKFLEVFCAFTFLIPIKTITYISLIYLSNLNLFIYLLEEYP
ncbi:hypothetical protein GXM_06260 [Nostoc sphaeroides CCNUC1]|uniref:Uncharacterized protein n=1 Tax=Nostoc sphaeroides CCNUC1 TaxID=2653204 RepID=A0A5P8W993_9NOSO|nr:hypothetical protein GXM_06260 [Nostoc sphaeroides CCNUC1]